MFAPFAYALDAAPAQDIFARLAPIPYSIFLDSADRAHPSSRYSFIAFHPFEMVEAKDGRVTVTNRDQQLSFRGDPFRFLRGRMTTWEMDFIPRDHLPPFQGGVAGFFGYDLARNIEKLPSHAKADPHMPDMAVGLYDQVVAFDHAQNKSWFIALASDETAARTKFEHFKKLMAQPAPAGSCAADLYWQPRVSRDQYETAIRQAIEYINAGDIFQANLSQSFDAPLPPGFDAYAHYLNLREVNPAPFASFMNFGRVKLSSASPERFLLVKDRHAITQPVKGTRKRLDDPQADKQARDELLTSIKDRAENMMIVDLLRNDFSRVCEDFSITEPDLCRLESFAGVHHLVSTVTGLLRADKKPLNLLRACFPGGSISGVPKVRAMEIIDELEPVRRGPYCGAMGYIGFDGCMDMNIAIRTLVYQGNSVRLNVGGGIVADSNPAAEYEETLTKAQKIFDSFAPRERKAVTA